MPFAITQPTIQRFPATENTRLIEALTRDGCIIITNFCTPSDIDQINTETHPFLLADKPWKGALFPPETRRCPRLVSRSSIAREWIVSPVINTLISHFLAKTTSNYYGNELHTYTTQPIVNIGLTMEIGPGGAAQRLHRDARTFIRTTALTERKQAGSHLWGMDRIPTVAECVNAEMRIGEALVLLGSVYHCAGSNSTTHEKRMLHGLFFCQGILRTEENHYLTNSKEEILSWSPEVQEKMGFFLSSPNIGFCDFRSPVDFLRNPVITGDFIPDSDPTPMVKIVSD